MKILHMISGGDTGGAKTHVFSLMSVLPKLCEVKVVCFIKGQFFDELQEIDVESELVEQKSRFDMSVLDRLCEIISKDGTDIIHAHGARANFIASKLKKRINIPVVTTVHSDYLLDFDGLYKKILYTSLNISSLKKLDYYIGVSSSFKDMLISRGFTPNKIFTVYNGMDYSKQTDFCSKEEFAKRIGIEYDENLTYIGLIGRHDFVKGHDIFVKGAGEVLKQHQDVRFIIAGDGDGRGALVELCKKLGIEDKVIFAGFIKDIYSFINFIDINTLTSRCESFPYVLMEGAKFSKPTVSSDVGGISDLIINNKTGFLFENENYTDFANKLINLIDNKELRENFGKALNERATGNFSNTSLAKTHVDIYNAILRDTKETTKYDAVLSGYYGFHNSGDDALLLGIVQSLREVDKDIRLLVLSKCPKETRLFCRCDAAGRFNLPSLIKAVKNTKMLINGGGSLIQDATSSKSLMYYLYVMHLAKKFGKKVYIYANGLGPLSDKNLNIASKVVSDADLITLRDRLSLTELDRMGVSGVPVHVTADPALLLAPSQKEVTDAIFKKENINLDNRKYMCIAIRSWSKNDADFVKKIANICDYAFEKWNLVPVFLPMKPQSDTKISQSVVAAMKNKGYVLSGNYPVCDILSIVKNSHTVLAMRLHSLIYALGTNVPAIGITYDPKIDGFLEYAGIDKTFCASNLEVEKIKECLDYTMNNHSDIKEALDNKRTELCKMAHYNAVLAKKLIDNEDVTK